MQYLQSPNANESQARALNAEINDLQRQLSELRLKTWFGMRAQMTPEQIQKLNQMKGQFRGGQGNGDRHFGGPSGMMPLQDRMLGGAFHQAPGHDGSGPDNNNDEGSDPNL
jgi:Spy/CpxP family protein refolding chaperone